MKSSELYSSTVCDACKKELETAVETKEKFGRNQTRLLKFVQEQKSPEQSSDGDADKNHKKNEESRVDQFNINNLKLEEVVVKIEPVDFNDFFVKDAGLFEFFELPKPAANDDPPRKIELVSPPSEMCAKVPTTYKRCYVCEKSVSASSFLKHVSVFSVLCFKFQSFQQFVDKVTSG